MVALDLRPVSIVTGVGFRRLMYACEPGYRVPSSTQVLKLLKKKHSDGLSRLRTMLASVSGVGLTTDMWTSRALDGYITLTAHFINDD